MGAPDVRAQRERGARLTRAVDSAQRSSTLAQALYEAGEADFLSVLDAHTQLLDTQRDLVQAQTDAAVSAVSLTWRSAAAGRTRVKNQRSRASPRNTEGQAMNDSTTTLTPGAVPDRRTVVILTQSIARTPVRLGWPTAMVLVARTLVNVMETWFVSFLGTDPLAGVAQVFRGLIMLPMMSNGGIGGGVSAAVARDRGRTNS